MKTQIRRYLVDVNSTEYTDAQLEIMMQDAAENLWDIMMRDGRGKKILETVQAPQAVVANYDEYPIPSDTRRLQALEYREYTTFWSTLTTATVTETTPANWKAVTDGSFRIRLDDRYYNISGIDFSSISGAVGSMSEVASVLQAAVRAATGGSETVTWSGTGSKFTFSCYDRCGYMEAHPYASGQSWTDLSTSSWCNGRRGSATPAVTSGAPEWVSIPHQPDETDRIEPNRSYTLTRTNSWGTSIQGWYEIDQYWAKIYPVVVSSNGILRFLYIRTPTFPSNSYETFLDMPEGIDSLLEFLVPIRAALEKVEDDGAILQAQVFGQTFQSRLDNFYSGIGGGNVRTKRHIIDVG